jgi:hypothetical protein
MCTLIFLLTIILCLAAAALAKSKERYSQKDDKPL